MRSEPSDGSLQRAVHESLLWKTQCFPTSHGKIDQLSFPVCEHPISLTSNYYFGLSHPGIGFFGPKHIINWNADIVNTLQPFACKVASLLFSMEQRLSSVCQASVAHFDFTCAWHLLSGSFCTARVFRLKILWWCSHGLVLVSLQYPFSPSPPWWHAPQPMGQKKLWACIGPDS